MIAVADASPLISLGRLGALDLLRAQFSKVFVPQEVWLEATAGNAALPGARAVVQADWLHWLPPIEPDEFDAARQKWGLGRGETSAIIVAHAAPGSVVLLDDQRARRVAASLNLPLQGTLGVLERSYLCGQLPDLLVAYRSLLQGGHYLSRSLLEASLRRCGLSPSSL